MLFFSLYILSARRVTESDSISVNFELAIVKSAVPVPEPDFISQSCNVEVPDTEKADLASNVYDRCADTNVVIPKNTTIHANNLFFLVFILSCFCLKNNKLKMEVFLFSTKSFDFNPGQRSAHKTIVFMIKIIVKILLKCLFNNYNVFSLNSLGRDHTS